MSEFCSVWLQFDKKIGLFNILNPAQRREGTSSLSLIFVKWHYYMKQIAKTKTIVHYCIEDWDKKNVTNHKKNWGNHETFLV